MPAPTTADAFLACLRKSNLVEPDVFDKHLASLRSSGSLPDEPKPLAARLIRDGLLTAFQARELLRGHHKGFYLGNYRVLEPLGAGGTSRVFLCEHAAMGHRVAMKVVSAAEGEDPSLVERFLREARANGAVNHPNLVRAHDFNRVGKHFYLVMDYVEGVSLHELVRRDGPLDPARAAQYVAQAAEGLAHLHENGLVHRDLTPANLLLDRKGAIKILDLGLACFLSDKRDALTERYDACQVLGTVDYLSPEQATRSHDVDIRADVYGLGATFYFLLTGRAPFEGKTVPQKLLAHQMHAPQEMTSVRPEVPAGMAAVVHKMLAKRAADRYQTPAEVIAALRPWAGAPGASPARPLPKKATRLDIDDHTPLPTGRLSPAVVVRASGDEKNAPPPPRTRSRGLMIGAAAASGLLLGAALARALWP